LSEIIRSELTSLPRSGTLSLLLLLALGLAGGSAEAARRAADRELLILSTTSNRGEVDPCG
jgi:hypothetical protein